MEETKKVVFLESAYSLLLYIMMDDNFEEDSIFVYHGKSINGVFEHSKVNVETIYIPREEYINVIEVKNLFKRKIAKKKYKKYLKEKLLDLIKEKTHGCKIEYFGNDNEVEPKILWKEIEKFTVIEDGWSNYRSDHFEAYLKRFKNKFKKKEDLKRGLSPKVEKIILSGLTKVPEIISEKVEIIDFKKLWKKKTEIQKQKIYNFFGMETADIEKISRKKVIFLSQPLEEDESLTHEETVELYRKIFKNYNENDILFKLHPRGIFTYKNEFPQIEIFTSKIPFQIFEYMGVDFDTIATIYSTAVWDIKNAKKIDFFGTKVHPKLLAQFGNIER